jgi:hypothetical protein
VLVNLIKTQERVATTGALLEAAAEIEDAGVRVDQRGVEVLRPGENRVNTG